MTKENTRAWLNHCDSHERAMNILAREHEDCHVSLQRSKEGSTQWRAAANGQETLSRVMSYMLLRSQQIFDVLRRAA